MHIVRACLPALTILIATLVAALPLGLPPEGRFVLPLLPYVVLHHWATLRPRLVPSPLAFLAGLFTDVVSFGPLGYWALVYLIGWVVATQLAHQLSGGFIGRLIWLVLTLGLLAVLQLALSSVLFLRFEPWQPVLLATAIVIAAYPVLLLALGPLDHIWPRSSNAGLTRGS